MNNQTTLKIGHPLLQQVAAPVSQQERQSGELQQWIQGMKDTMIALNGAGLAAPQIGLGKRILMFELNTNPRYPGVEPIPYTVLINPEMVVVDATLQYAWEGCLSVPGYRGKVPRFHTVRYSGEDEKGEWVEREVSGFHARVFQHEYDHLEGILYPQRVEDLRLFGLESELFPDGYALGARASVE